MITYSLKIIDIRQETDDTITLCLKQPGLKKIRYISGQYLSLIFRINGRRYIRAYSLSSAPGIDQNLEITVKRVNNGIVSNHIIDVLNVGDTVEVMPPMGDFIYKNTDHTKDVYLWGVGSGITPLISIAKQVLHTQEDNVYLIYGNRNHESTIFHKEIAHLKAQFNERFKVKHFHTKNSIDSDNENLIQGRIDKDKAEKILHESLNLPESNHFICGPSGLKESVYNALKAFNVSDANIFSEDFEIIKDPKDFTDIFTQIVSLTFKGEKFDVEVTKGKSVLEAALDSGIELPYSCQTGSCSICKGILVSGESKMVGLSKERNDLSENEYLLCCTYPMTNNIDIII